MIGDGLSGPEATDRLLEEWTPSSEKDPDMADPDIPVLKQAKAEQAKLQ